jgi:hypothetical protein
MRYGPGRGGGFRQGLGFRREAPAAAGYEYVGPCRCGYGPNAYYRDSAGRVVSPAAAATGGFSDLRIPARDLAGLRAEVANLRQQIRRFEGRIAGEG